MRALVLWFHFVCKLAGPWIWAKYWPFGSRSITSCLDSLTRIRRNISLQPETRLHQALQSRIWRVCEAPWFYDSLKQVRADVEATGMEGAMQKAYADAHKTLTLRIDALGALVRSAEDSCHRAETIGRRVAASADQVAFQGLPHMASPHRLIRRLTAGHPTAALTH